jgi:glycogen synthase
VWDEAKNIQLLIDAAPKINYIIKVAGEQQFENNELNMAANGVQYLGRLNTQEIACELSQAAMYVLPAKYEPFGLSALEAAYAGCALVLGDIPSLREIWQDAAIYVDTNDEAALAQTINTLMQDPEQLEFYQHKAAERANEFSANVMANEYYEVYGHLKQLKEASIKPQTV